MPHTTGSAGGEIEVFTAAFGIESEFDGDGLKQGGFARTILANKKGDGGMKLEPFQMLNGRDTKWIFVKAFHQFTFKPDGIDEWAPDFGTGSFGI